jgi:hypothetical protein
MGRHFTLAQAQRLLPEVERLLEAAVQSRERMSSREEELATLQRHVMLMGGVRIDAVHTFGLKAERDHAARQLKESVESIQELGVQVKDLEMGLVDFPALYHGREVLLCWRLGEPGIEYWHGLEDGFKGRRKIDRDFLDHHEGDEPH